MVPAPVSIIGAGRIGTALHDKSLATGSQAQLITRTQGWHLLEQPAGSPIAVCVRNDDLDGVLARTPAHRRSDLVFLQNGMLRSWLAHNGLGKATRGLLFFAVAARGAAPVPGGESPLCGPHANAMADWLGALGLPARAVAGGEFSAVELEKLLWNTCMGVLCQAHSCDVATAVTAHRASLDALVAELTAVAGRAFAPTPDPGDLADRITAYSLQIADYRAAVKEWPWRNGWFVEEALRRAMACPTHARLLAAAGIAPAPDR